jgi:predicted metal-dependent phosphoesterase TrpH
MVNLQQAKGWLKAELHCHSKSNRLSYFPWFYDSVQTVEEIIAKSVEMNIRILSITDHDSLGGYWKAKEFIEKYNINIILVPGCEITTKNGHILAFGILKEIKRKLTPEETISQIHSQGGLAIAAHPFGPMGLGKMVNKLEIDGLEFGSLMTKRWNNKTVKTADNLGINLIAGSDAHMIRNIGDGMTLFPPNIKTWEDVLESIRTGNISYDCKRSGLLRAFGTNVRKNLRMARKNRFRIKD